MYPALTVLETLELEPDSFLWVGSQDGMEKALVTRNNIPFKSIPAAGVHGVGLARLPGNLLKLIRGFFSSLKILREFKPDALLFTGGYVAVPMAAAGLGTTSLLYVPDIEPGLAIKTLARFANRIALSTETSRAYFPDQNKLSVTGYPVRPGLKKWTRENALDYFKLVPSIPTLAVAGGSKGARSINYALIKILPELLEEMQVIHLTGHLDWERMEANAQKLGPNLASRYQIFPYLHEMGAVLAAADLIVSRAGASTLGEYPLFGLPAILVPYPHAWRYQKINAAYLADRGAAVIVKDEDLDEKLYDQTISLITDPQHLSLMSQSMKSLATPNAAENIARLITEMTGIPENEVAA